MVTKEALIAEIERVQPQDIETVYKLIQVFTLSTKEREIAEDTASKDVESKQRFSFIGIGHSGKRNLSTQVESILAQAASRREGWSIAE